MLRRLGEREAFLPTDIFTDVSREDLVEVLEAAGNLIDDWGLAKGQYRKSMDEGYRYCAVGAIDQAIRLLGPTPKDHFKVLMAQRQLASTVSGLRTGEGNSHDQVTDWNDSAERTKEEVVDGFRRAAAFVKEQP